jgi:hypothetical protein
MNAERCKPRLVSAFFFISILMLTACAPTATPTLYRPPGGYPSPTPASIIPTPLAVTAFVIPTEAPTLEPTTPVLPCTNELTWLADLTFLDDTLVLPGQYMDKQWSIQNSGTCDWNARYHLRNINGETLGTSAEMPLFPARAGATVTLSLVFLAPSDAGTYRSEWQAVTPDGALFGDTVYIKIVVSNP